MRRLLVLVSTMVVALVATASAEAARVGTPGAESLSLRDGVGRAVISQRGALLGHLTQGQLIVADLLNGPSPTVIVRGYESRRILKTGATRYRGADLSFRVFGGTWRVRIRGSGIDLSAVVRGSLGLEGVSGTFAIGDSPYRLWPSTMEKFDLGA